MEKLVKSLLSGELDMALSGCVLRQVGAASPNLYEGPGLLTQKLDKSIQLRMFAAPLDYMEAIKRDLNRDLTPGVLVPNSEYYDFEGKDPFGTVWRASRISTETDFGSGIYIRARPRVLEKTVTRIKPVERPVVAAFLLGKIELPWHGVDESGEPRQSLARFESTLGRFEWRITKTDDGAWLTFKCKDDSQVELRFEAFLRGLSILTGSSLKPICLSICEGQRETTRILNRLHEPDTEKLLVPISTERDFAEDAHLFLERFMEKTVNETGSADGPCDFAHRYWHRILRARSSDIENSSLVLSVAGEGLVKKTLLAKTEADYVFVSKCE